MSPETLARVRASIVGGKSERMQAPSKTTRSTQAQEVRRAYEHRLELESQRVTIRIRARGL